MLRLAAEVDHPVRASGTQTSGSASLSMDGVASGETSPILDTTSQTGGYTSSSTDTSTWVGTAPLLGAYWNRATNQSP